MKNIFKDEQVKKNIVTYSISGVLVVAGALLLFNIKAVGDFITGLLGVLSPFIWGIAFAFLLSKFANFLEKKLPEKTKFKTKRFISSVASVLLLILIIFLIVIIIAPQIGESITSLSNMIIDFGSNASKWITSVQNQSNLPDDVVEDVYEYSNTLVSNLWSVIKEGLPSLVNFTINTVSGVLNFVIGFIVTLYMLNDRERIVDNFRKLFKAYLSDKAYTNLTIVYNVSVTRFYKFFEGKLIDSLIIGILCFIIMSILKLDYAVLISLIVGITNIIPFFGPFIGAIPSALILLMVDYKQALIFIVLIFLLQQLDGNVIGPKILGDSVGLSSLWIMFAILVGGAYFGFFGMLLGVPIFSVIYYLVAEDIKRRLLEKEKK